MKGLKQNPTKLCSFLGPTIVILKITFSLHNTLKISLQNCVPNTLPSRIIVVVKNIVKHNVNLTNGVSKFLRQSEVVDLCSDNFENLRNSFLRNIYLFFTKLVIYTNGKNVNIYINRISYSFCE